MSESIDQIAAATAENLTPSEKERARAYVADLPEWHPVRRLMTGTSQWVGELKPVYIFLRLLCIVYDDYIWRPAADHPPFDAHAKFLRTFPNAVIHRGRRPKLHDLYAKARAAIAAADAPHKRAEGLEAFDRAFSDLIRAIHVPPPPLRAHAPDLRVVQK